MYKKYLKVFCVINAVFVLLFFTEAARLGRVEEKAVCSQSTEMIGEIERNEYLEAALPLAVSNPRVMDESMLVRQKVYNLSDAEYQLLLKLVEAEAGGEDLEGKILVANVVFNRVAASKFPNTVSEVILQRDEGGAQFSPISDGRISRVRVSDETRKAVEHVIYGEDISYGALYFVARKSANPDKLKWFDQCLTPVLKHGRHEFFK